MPNGWLDRAPIRRVNEEGSEVMKPSWHEQRTSTPIDHGYIMGWIHNDETVLMNGGVAREENLYFSLALLLLVPPPPPPPSHLLPSLLITTLPLFPINLFNFISRISFKILLLTFQCLHNMAPSYLQELLNKYTPTRNLRSSQKNLLECPVLGTRFYGERTFSFGGPLLWNAVPLHLKEANSVNNFKSLLKTFLFQEYYNWE